MIKKLNKELNRIWPSRFKDNHGYKFDRLIFNIYLLAFLLVAYQIAAANWPNYDFYSCETDGYNPSAYNPLEGDESHFKIVDGLLLCKNPFYQAPSWKNEPYLIPGKYGHDITPDITFIQWFAVLGFLAAILINHVLYNRGFKTK